MKEKIKKIPLLGPAIVRTYWFFNIHQDFKRAAWPNVKLKDAEKGKPCFILATGPSIKTQNLAVLAGDKNLCISVSNFFIHPDFKTIKPKYHLFVASHPPVTPEQYTEWFRDAEKHFPEGQHILISVTDRHLVENNNLFRRQKVHYYYLSAKEIDPYKDIDFTEPLPMIGTSAQTALYLGIYLGSTNIHMIGVDHNNILNAGNIQHFYDEKNNAMTKLGYNGWDSKDMEEEFAANVRLWRLYKKIREYARIRNLKIFNCSPTSMLDVFERKSLEQSISDTENRS
jgi:hypothetical protein